MEKHQRSDRRSEATVVPARLPAVSSLAHATRASFAVLVSVQAMDLWTTHEVLRRGGDERSPLSLFLLDNWGIAGLAVGKAVFTAVTIAAAVELARRGFGMLAARALLLVNAVYVLIIAWNSLQPWLYPHSIRV